MIRKYKVTRYQWDRDRIFDNIEDLREYVYDPDKYIDECSDSIYDLINENNQGFSFGSRDWSATEVLQALDEDLLAENVAAEANWYCEEELPYQYDDEIESLGLNEEIDIRETHCTVSLIDIIPETEEDAEELGLNLREMESEAAALL